MNTRLRQQVLQWPRNAVLPCQIYPTPLSALGRNRASCMPNTSFPPGKIFTSRSIHHPRSLPRSPLLSRASGSALLDPRRILNCTHIFRNGDLLRRRFLLGTVHPTEQGLWLAAEISTRAHAAHSPHRPSEGTPEKQTQP